MKKEEFFTLQPGDLVTDSASGGKIREVKALRMYQGRVMSVVFESLRPNGKFRNFCGQECPNRKMIGLSYCDGHRLTLYRRKKL